MLSHKKICPCGKNGYNKDTEKAIGIKFQRIQTYEKTRRQGDRKLKREDYEKTVGTEDFLFSEPYKIKMMEEVGEDDEMK
jgi:hypothetical protein